MDEQVTGTPVANAAAPTDTGNDLSPTFETDTQVQGSGSADKGGTDEAATLRAEVEELRKRVSRGTMSFQQERKVREELEGRLKRWKEAGVDPDEIDRALAAAANPSGTAPQNAPQQLPKNVMTTERYQAQRVLDKWADLKESHFEKNPELDTEHFHDWYDTRARRIADKEIAEFGRLVSTPKEILIKVNSDFNSFQSTVEKKVRKAVSETREKVAGQGAVESSHTRVKVDRDSTDDKPITNTDWAAQQKERQRRIREGR